jgi:hypothetical protein
VTDREPCTCGAEIDCPCRNWAVQDIRTSNLWGIEHHPACDGTGRRRDTAEAAAISVTDDVGLTAGEKIRASYVRDHPEYPWPVAIRLTAIADGAAGTMTDGDNRPLFASDKVSIPASQFGFLVPAGTQDAIDAAFAARRHAALATANAHQQLLAELDGLVAAVLTLHEPVIGRYATTCSGCCRDGEPPEWPCATYRLVAEQCGRQFVDGTDTYGPRMTVINN